MTKRNCSAMLLLLLVVVVLLGAEVSSATQRPTKSRFLTRKPTSFPTNKPSPRPSSYPTKPTPKPTSQHPTHSPTAQPTLLPTSQQPTRSPTLQPTLLPTAQPTHSPTKNPTVQPTSSPTSSQPTASPVIRDCVAFNRKEKCLSVSERCEWIQPNSKQEYGCQPRGYCQLNKGTGLKAQCNTRSLYCKWTGSKCVSLCPVGARPKLQGAIDGMCTKLSLSDTTTKHKAVKQMGTEANGHFGSAVAGGGADFDGDGKPDYAVGSPDLPPKFSEDRDGTGGIHLYLQSGKYYIKGVHLEGQFGTSLAFVDLDSDGLDDLLVTAPHAEIRTGEVYIIWGRTDFAAQYKLGGYDNLATSKLVTRIKGASTQATFGSAISKAGDFNGDGYQDVIIAAKAASVAGRAYCGQAFILFGGQQRNTSTRMLRIVGRDVISYFGTAVSGGKDLNGDGYADVVVGAPWADTGVGKVFVIFGRNVDLTATQTVVDLSTDKHVHHVTGEWNFAQIKFPDVGKQGVTWPNFGSSVSMVGDVNVDGFEDIAIGAPGFDSTNKGTDCGKVYVVLGTKYDTPAAVLPVTGFTLLGSEKSGNFGSALAQDVDFNGDGYADILISSPAANGGKGTALVVYGSCQGFAISFSNIGATKSAAAAMQSTLLTHSTALRFGSTLASVGDVNDDGKDDLLIGAPRTNSEDGMVELVYSC